MSKIVAGLAAAVPLSIMGIIYILVRGHDLVEMVTADDPSTMTDTQWLLIFGVTFALVPFGFGLVSALIYGAMGSSQLFLALAVGLGVLATALAIITRTPMMVEKIVMNFAVALAFGILIPLLSK